MEEPKDIEEINVYEVGELQEFKAGEKIFKRHKEDDPIFQADWVAKLMDAKRWTQKEASNHIDLTQPQISRLLSLKTDLVPEFQQRARLPTSKNKAIAQRTAYILSKLPKQKQKQLLEKDKITIEMAREIRKQYRRKQWIEKDSAGQSLKDRMKGTTFEPFTEPQEDKTETDTKKKEHREKPTQQQEAVKGKIPNSKKWSYVYDDPRYRKVKCTCPQCGNTFTVGVKEEENTNEK